MSDSSTVRILDASEVDPELTLDMGEVSEDLVSLKWKSHRESLLGGFPNLLNIEKFVDVTLMCQSKILRCHKMILSSCSPYFDVLLSSTPCTHPVVLITDLRFWEIQAIIDFMYKGEVSIEQHNVTRLLEVANKLQVKGLCASNIKTEEVNEVECMSDSGSHVDTLSPHRRKRRKVAHSEAAVVPSEKQSTEVVVIEATQRADTNHTKTMNQSVRLDENVTLFKAETDLMLDNVDALDPLASTTTSDAEVVEIENTSVRETREAREAAGAKAWKVGVTRTLDYLKLKVDSVLKKVDAVLEAVEHLPSNGERTFDDAMYDAVFQSSMDLLDQVKFPLTKLDELNKVETELRKKETFDCMVKKTSTIGGINVKETTKRILRFLFSDELAQHFSYLGFKKKHVFSELKLNAIIFNAVKLNKTCQDYTDSEIENVIKSWLRHAKFRFLSKNSKNTSQDVGHD